MIQYKGYIAKVEYDPAAQILHGEVVGIRDVITFQTDSPKDVEKEFHASVDDYLAFCAQRGESPDKPFSGRFVVRLDADLHRVLASLAKASRRSLNDLVVEYLYREASLIVPSCQQVLGAPEKNAASRHSTHTRQLKTKRKQQERRKLLEA